MRIIPIILFTCCIKYSNAEEKKKFLETKPSGADVLNTELKVIGKTPFDISKGTIWMDTIYITMKNYDTTCVAFLSNASRKQFPAIASICEPCGIEMNSVSGKEEPSGVLVLRRTRILPEAENVRIFTTLVDVFQFDFKDTTAIGKIDGKTMKWGDKKIAELSEKTYHEYIPVTTGLKNSYINPILYNISSKNKVPIRFRIKANFRNLEINFSELDKKKMRGNSSMDSEWEIYNKFDSITPIAKFNFHSSIYRTQNKNTNFVSSLIHDAECQMLAIDTLFDFLCKQDQKTNIISSGPEIILNRPLHLTFTNLKEINRHSNPSVITVECKNSFGSGFFISDKGYLVTNYHVIEDEPKITIIINKTTKLDAKVIKFNEDFDLALLKVEYDSLPGLWLADSDSIEAGDPVVAIGTPLDKMLSSTLTKGIVSGTRDFSGTKMIQTDVSINSGSSGGPLINEKGEVIGMSTLKVKAKGVEGIGFCIPSNDIIKRLNIVYK